MTQQKAQREPRNGATQNGIRPPREGRPDFTFETWSDLV